jgi:D-glycero-alpha-D-manno-heptose 1-phosphate guanylyltransferase
MKTFADIPVLILAGGLGTRLRAAVPDAPKVLAPVCGGPFLAHLLDQIAATLPRRVVLLTGYCADQVEQTFGSRHGELHLSYIREATPLGTGGAVRQALDQLHWSRIRQNSGATPRILANSATTSEDRTVLLMNGDSYCGVDFAKLYALHRRANAALTMAVVRVSDASRFGRVHFDKLGRINSFVEKGAVAGPGWINAGVSIIERALLEQIPAGQPTSLEHTWLPHWLAPHRLLAYPTRAAFLDIGTPASFAAAQTFFAPETRHALPA